MTVLKEDSRCETRTTNGLMKYDCRTNKRKNSIPFWTPPPPLPVSVFYYPCIKCDGEFKNEHSQIENSESREIHVSGCCSEELRANFSLFKRCGHDTRNKLGTRLISAKNVPLKGFLKKMGNKLSCSCGPLKINSYRFEAGKEPWQAPHQPSRRRTGDGNLLSLPLCRLWAEVFHVTTSSSGTVKWTQVSEDLVPVNITCLQQGGTDSHHDPSSAASQGSSDVTIFHITAYNSQVEKILDVKLIQPGTRIGQASECFIYWKDTSTNDTWGLNFTSPIDAKQFRECCARTRGNSCSGNKPSSRSTPASPSRSREPQCTCMTSEQYARLRASNDPRIRGGMLPCGGGSSHQHGSSSSASRRRQASQSTPSSPTRGRKVPQCTCMSAEQFEHLHRYQYASSMRGSQTLPRNLSESRDDVGCAEKISRSESRAGGDRSTSRGDPSSNTEGYGSVRERDRIKNAQKDIRSSKSGSLKSRKDLLHSKSVDYAGGGGGPRESSLSVRRMRSKSTDQLHNQEGSGGRACRIDSGTLKKMLKPVVHTAPESPVTSPEGGRRRNNIANIHGTVVSAGHRGRLDGPTGRYDSDRDTGFMSEPDTGSRRLPRPNGNAVKSVYRDIGRPSTGNNSFYNNHSKNNEGGGSNNTASRPGNMKNTDITGGKSNQRHLFLDFNERDPSPPSDTAGMFDSHCFATTPSSSNGNSDFENTPASPTSQLLMDYEEHLRNTLEKGMDAESYSLHTFEALLTRSMENLESILYHCKRSSSTASDKNGVILRDDPIRRRNAISSDLGFISYSKREELRRLRLISAVSLIHEKLAIEKHTREQDLHDLGPGLNPQSTYLKRKNRSRTMPSRPVPDKYTRPRSVNSNLEASTRSSNNVIPDPMSSNRRTEQSGYLSDRNEMTYRSSSMIGGGAGGSKSFINNGNDRRAYLSSHNLRNGRQDSIRSGYVSDHESRNELRRRNSTANNPNSTSVSNLNSNIVNNSCGNSNNNSHFVQQQISIDSVHSHDSRLCYLTSSEISDEDRMSLTTAVSDEEEVESNHNSPYKTSKASSSSAASFNCTGAVRKAGFLSVKKWLLRKKHQVELARKRGWKGYWVCLKGTTLLFYPCDSREGRSVEATPKHLIIVDGAIMQAIPEHPKRDYIFCLSTAFGDAYLFQAPCQVELENWVNSIHSACAAAFARHRGKTGTLHLLQEEIYRLDKGIESDQKLKHMAELQLSVVSEQNSKHQIDNQITQWEENLERLHCEQFRLRCYMASLQSEELPNPKSVLTQVTPSTKVTLNRLGVFTVSSFHAYICARSPSLLNNLLAGRGATKRRAPVLSRSNSGSSRRSLTLNTASGPASSPGDTDKLIKVTLPDNQVVTFYLNDAMTVDDFLAAGCLKKGLNPVEHFVRVKKRRDMPNQNYFVPHRSDLIETYLHTHEIVEVCAKILYQVELSRDNLEIMWGFSVEAELVENSEKQDELCCYVSRVEERSVAMSNGIIKGDEIMVINGAIVSDLDMMFIESVLQEEISLCMMMRSSRTDLTSVLKSTDDMIERLVCPPPPSDNAINEDIISSLIVPAPEWNKNQSMIPVSPDGDSTTAPTSQGSERSDQATVAAAAAAAVKAQQSLKQLSARGGGTGVIIGNQPALDVDALLRGSKQHPSTSPSPGPPPQPAARKSLSVDAPSTGGPTLMSPTESLESGAQMNTSRSLTDAEKLRKVILELVDTEHAYVRHLGYLMKTYLEPLKREAFLSNSEISTLFGNIQEIYNFQQQFLRTLEEALESEAQFHSLDSTSQFKNVLFSIGSAFLYYVNHFKLYSSFCASHSKAQKALHPNDGNHQLQDFLLSLNPRQQHSTALESYLIKPIQRILKYPLLLQQLKNLTRPESDEQQHLIEALIGMEKVAEHINEMQRIHEEYGAIFDHLFRQHQKTSKQQSVDLSPGDLLYYGGVEWLNISDFLGKIKKGLELHAMCFVFKTAVVFLCKERLRHKKKSLIGSSNKANAAEVEIIRYQVLIPVNEVQVRASSVKDVDSHYLWELIHLKNQIQRRNEKVYHLSNSTAEFRNAFLKTIRQIIRESVRNMNLPSGLEGRKPAPPLRSESSRKASTDVSNSTRTLQISRKRTPGSKQQQQPYSSLQRHLSSTSGTGVGLSEEGNDDIDYDNVENCQVKLLSSSSVVSSRDHHHHQRPVKSHSCDPPMTSSRNRNMRTLGDGLDELGDFHSETDSTRDGEGSSGIKSEGEETMDGKTGGSLGSQNQPSRIPSTRFHEISSDQRPTELGKQGLNLERRYFKNNDGGKCFDCHLSGHSVESASSRIVTPIIRISTGLDGGGKEDLGSCRRSPRPGELPFPTHRCSTQSSVESGDSGTGGPQSTTTVEEEEEDDTISFPALPPIPQNANDEDDLSGEDDDIDFGHITMILSPSKNKIHCSKNNTSPHSTSSSPHNNNNNSKSTSSSVVEEVVSALSPPDGKTILEF
ncbi:protein still life, isoform SIF type 1 isoform X11 [Lepeophtheirus salmonis]|uniref:protein still life, isoform SIF type 1 isoform X11 n=1 Tax=Lepeophtheirus salmonis TaxID=72036 RepID=UPI003AF36AB4